MPAPLLAAALPFIPSAFQLGLGLIQNHKSNRMNPQRPAYQIPQAELEATALARQRANDQRMPGQSVAEQNARAATASAARAAAQGGSGAGYQAVVAAANQNEQNAMNQIGVQGAQFQMQNQQNLQQQLGRMGQFQDRKAQWEQRDPYMAEAQAKSALKTGGLQNLYNGVSNAASGAMMMLNKTEDDPQPTTPMPQIPPMYMMGQQGLAPIPGYNGGYPWQQQPYGFPY